MANCDIVDFFTNIDKCEKSAQIILNKSFIKGAKGT